MIVKKTIYIVVPFYNESGLVKHIFENRALDEYQVILVDDGSNKPADLSAVTRSYYLVTHSENLGQGAALQTGMELAKTLQAAIVIHFDADGQHKAEEIGRLISPIEKGSAKVVLGSRFLKQDNIPNATKVPAIRRFILQAARVIQFYFTGLWLSDSQNGFRAIDGEVLPLIEMKQNRMAHAIEIISICKDKKIKMKEMPVTIGYNKPETEEGQKLSNGFFIVLRLLAAQVIRHRVWVTLLLSAAITACYWLGNRSADFLALIIIGAGILLVSNLLVGLAGSSVKKLYGKTKQVREAALATAKKINF